MASIPLVNLAILWDMDGVIIDTGEFHYRAWQELLGEFGITLTEGMFKNTFGMNNVDMIHTLFGDQVEEAFITQLSERKEAQFRRSIAGQASLMTGVGAWLEWLQAHDVPQALASSAPCQNIDFLIDELGIRSYFQAVVSGTEMPGKPDPAVFLAAARQLEVRSDHCLVIEDSIPGITAAKRAGMKCLAVATTNPFALLTQADLALADLGREPPAAILNRLFGAS